MTEIQTLDLEFSGATEMIASFLAPVDGGFVLFDPGPVSTVDAIERRAGEVGFRLSDLKAVFATHVHLDHSGGAGVLAQRTGCAVFCHPLGAPHLQDPAAKLLPSAERLYGDKMEPLWGTTVGVPEDQLRIVGDGKAVTVDGLEVVGWHTPGHASHHVAWQIGDAVPMPPPDIDVEMWRDSLAVLRRLAPSRLLLTHFGAFDDPIRHIDELEGRLVRWTEVASGVVSNGGDKNALGVELERMDDEEMQSSLVPPEAVVRYRRLCPVKESSAGLFRYCSLQK
jgi:glyoxylase-like metal-dependent hydrolase (beta-lactamase superfamily II)